MKYGEKANFIQFTWQKVEHTKQTILVVVYIIHKLRVWRESRYVPYLLTNFFFARLPQPGVLSVFTIPQSAVKVVINCSRVLQHCWMAHKWARHRMSQEITSDTAKMARNGNTHRGNARKRPREKTRHQLSTDTSSFCCASRQKKSAPLNWCLLWNRFCSSFYCCLFQTTFSCDNWIAREHIPHPSVFCVCAFCIQFETGVQRDGR